MPVLIDTSVWIDHLHRANTALIDLLQSGEVLTHPAVISELACGSIKRRKNVLADLDALPGIRPASDEECRTLIETQKLHGVGLGWTDIHLLSAARIESIPLWTEDKRLAAAATKLGCGWTRPSH